MLSSSASYGLGTFVWGIAALPAGLISSRLGLHNGIFVGQVIYIFALGLMLLIEGQPKALWPLWLIGCQAVIEVGVALITVSISPYLMAVTGEQERRYAFAVVQAAVPRRRVKRVDGSPGLYGGRGHHYYDVYDA